MAGDRFDAADELPARDGDPGVRRRGGHRPCGHRAPVELPATSSGRSRDRSSPPPWTASGGCIRPRSTAVQFNLIGSHDTPRAVTVMGGDPARVRLASVLQLTLPGAPSIYYGDELAMPGAADPGCRAGYPPRSAELEPAAAATRALVRAMIHARHRHGALRLGEVSVLASGERAIVLARTSGTDRAIVGVNAGTVPAALDLPVGVSRRARRGRAAGGGTRGPVGRRCDAQARADGSPRPRR